MADSIVKHTPLGCIIVEISLQEGAQIPSSEVADLIELLRETANNLEQTYQHCIKGQTYLTVQASLRIH